MSEKLPMYEVDYNDLGPNGKIKPCDYCGGHFTLFMRNDTIYYWMICTACECRGPIGVTPEQAIAAWNTRTPDPTTVKVLEEARTYLELMCARAQDMLNDALPKNMTIDHLRRTTESAWKRYDMITAELSRLKGAKE